MTIRQAIPTSPEELEATLENPKNLQDLLSNPLELTAWIKDYAHAQAKADKDMNQLIREQIQISIQDMAKNNGIDSDIPLMPSSKSRSRNAEYEETAPGVVLDRSSDAMSITEISHASYHKSCKVSNKARAKYDRIVNEYSSEIPSLGGFLVPEMVRSDLIQTALENSVMRRGALVFPMTVGRLSFPAEEDSSHTTGPYGIHCYWTAEGATITETDSSFSSTVFDAKKLTAATSVPNELIEDSVPAFTAYISRAYPAALAWAEDVAFLSGSGVGEPLGMLSAPATVVVAKEAGQAADTILWENIVKMYSRMLSSSLSNAVWIANLDTFPELALMALSVGTGGSAIWLNNGQVGPPMTILGRPVFFTEKVPTLGDQGDIGFYDLSRYGIGDRKAMTMDSSPHVKFLSDKTVYKLIQRVDGRPLVLSALTPANSSATLSPYVCIAARA
jgi:HK97 family phage major capsid protein